MRLTLDSPAAQTSPTELIAPATHTLDVTNTLIVNRAHLTEAYTKARFAAGRLSDVENLSELDCEAIDELCRSLYQATTALGEMLEAKGAAAS